MANQEQLAILKRGVEVWNQWRSEHAGIEVDLSDADLRSTDLSEVDLSDVDIFANDLGEIRYPPSGAADLSGANFRGADFRGADLSGADFRGADLRGAKLSKANLYRADLRKADLSEANLSGTHLSGANLGKANLHRADLSGANLRGAELSEVELSDANLSNANLSNANLSGAQLSSTDLSDAQLSGADLSNASLIRTNLSGTRLVEANLSEANLFGANLSEARLSSTDLTNARIGWTSFGDRDLREIKGLETVTHLGRSPLSINTIYLSAGDIPEAFVRGTGAPDIILDYIHSLVGKPIEYYSCFISYSSKDDAFAKRLYADLQSNNVRCWFAPEDLKWGERIRSGIDEAIRLHDKLLLILSKHSVASGWVEREVKTALAKERKEKRVVLFPVRVDGAVFESPFDWATEIRHERNVGDFTRWKSPDGYQKAFTRLLRDLKTEAQKMETRDGTLNGGKS